MQVMRNKKVWLLLMVMILAVSTVCFWAVKGKEKKAYANGRMVVVPQKESYHCSMGQREYTWRNV